MNTKSEGTSPSLPTLTITAAMVKRMLKKQNVRTTTEDAARWLARHKRRIENNLYCATLELVEDVLLDTTLVAWPDPEFNRMYKRIEKAVDDATDDYGESRGLQLSSSSSYEDSMVSLVQRLLRHKSNKPLRAFLVVELGFISAEDKIDGKSTREIPYFFELIYQKPKVTAKLTHRLDKGVGSVC